MHKIPYDSHFKLATFWENSSSMDSINFIDETGEQYTFIKCKKYLKRGTPVRAIFCYEGEMRIFNSNASLNRTKYMQTKLFQLQFFRPPEMDDCALDSEDSEGW